MYRSLALCAFLAAPPAMFSQVLLAPDVAPVTRAAVEPGLKDNSTSVIEDATLLPDAPSAHASSSLLETDEQAGLAPSAGSANRQVARRYAGIILPGQTAVPLHGHEKAVYGVIDSFNPFALIGVTLSAGWSHLIDSEPHYGTNAEAFGKREGASALRNTIQTLATDAVFSPMFHDDPRYYELGPPHKFVPRVVYAATRVVVTRSSNDGSSRINAPLLLGYGVAAGMNNLYYPDQDRGAKNTFENFASSLGGAAIGFEANEFLDDALRMVHLRK